MNAQQQALMAQAMAMSNQQGAGQRSAGGANNQQQLNQAMAMAQQMQGMGGQQQMGGINNQQQQLNQAMAMAQQMQGMGGATGGVNNQQKLNQAMAMAKQMQGMGGQQQMGGMNNQQQQLNQAMAMAQQMQGMGGQQQQMGGGMANPYASAPPAYAPPVPPMGAPFGGGGAGTVFGGGGGGGGNSGCSVQGGPTITCSFPDGSMVGWDKLRHELLLSGTGATVKVKHLPPRPTATMTTTAGAGVVGAGGGGGLDGPPPEPVEKQGMMTKLGGKKSSLLGDSWQPRLFRLTPTTISYAKDGASGAISTIPLSNGVLVQVVQSNSPAKRNRYIHCSSVYFTFLLFSVLLSPFMGLFVEYARRLNSFYLFYFVVFALNEFYIPCSSSFCMFIIIGCGICNAMK
jgi:hypothetical protein